MSCLLYVYLTTCMYYIYYVHATILEFILLCPVTLEILHHSTIDLYALFKLIFLHILVTICFAYLYMWILTI